MDYVSCDPRDFDPDPPESNASKLTRAVFTPFNPTTLHPLPFTMTAAWKAAGLTYVPD